MKNHQLTPRKGYFRTLYETAGLVLVSHLVTMILYSILLTTLENQMIGDEIEHVFRWVMFGFSMVCMTILGGLFTLLHYKNGDRRRAFLAATTAADIGDSAAAEGYRLYNGRLPLIETVIATAATAVLWLPEAILYSASVSTAGYGYGYSLALPIEDFFVSYVGLCQPFQNAFVGWLIGTLYLAAFQYLGRRLAYRHWDRTRIRR